MGLTPGVLGVAVTFCPHEILFHPGARSQSQSRELLEWTQQAAGA